MSGRVQDCTGKLIAQPKPKVSSRGLNALRSRSIKTRVTLFTLAFFVLSTLTLAFYGRGILREVVKGLLGKQQLSTAAFIAACVNQELDERRATIAAVAASLTPTPPSDGRALRTRLAQRQDWPRLFNDGAFLVRQDGVATVSIPASTVPSGTRVDDWDFIAHALKHGTTSVGLPPSGTPKAPQIGIAQPLVDAHGKVIGALVGFIDLDQTGVLRRFAQGGDDQNGGYLLVSAQHRRVAAGNDRSGVGEMLAAPTGHPALDRLLDGFEGSEMVVNARGEDVLVSAKRIPSTDWQVLVTLPGDAVFTPLRAARMHMLLATIVLALVASGAIWLILRRELTPMLTTVKALTALSGATQPRLPLQPLAIPSQGEIAELIASFNRLLATLGQREDALRVVEAELRIAATAFESHEAMIVTDAHGTILRVNKAFCESTGYAADEAVGQTPRLLKSGRHDATFYRQMWETVIRTGSWQGEVWDRRKNGEIYPKWLTVSALKDKNGAVTHYVGAHFDITERKQKEERIHQLAFYDPLTSLPNRRLLIDRLQRAMAVGKRSACNGALLFLDLDNFKSLNDTRGHLAGDLLLIEAANRLRQCVREMDTIARFGGDEFVVLLSELNADKTESAARTALVAEKIRAALSTPYLLTISREGPSDARFEHRCSASIGVALLVNDGARAEDLLKWADAAMYRAKAAGRNMIHFHDAG